VWWSSPQLAQEIGSQRERLAQARSRTSEEAIAWGEKVERLESEVDELRAAWHRHRVDLRLGVETVEPASEEDLERELRTAHLERDACTEARRLLDDRLADPALDRRIRAAESGVKDAALAKLYADSVAAHYREVLEEFLLAQAFFNELVGSGAPVSQTVHISPMASKAQAERARYAAWFRALLIDPQAGLQEPLGAAVAREGADPMQSYPEDETGPPWGPQAA
jgi:hypothetical protein